MPDVWDHIAGGGDPADFALGASPDQDPAPYGGDGSQASSGRLAAALVNDPIQGAVDAVRYPAAVMAGQVDPQSDDGIGRTLGMAALMAGPGLGMAEEGAAGAMGGKLAGKAANVAPAAAADPFADIMAALDAHAAANPVQEAAAHPRALPADQLVQQAPDGHFVAFHGSPATFDSFSLDHLGTGEGVQAQGHGAYFASDQNVGAHYADTHGAPRTLPDGSTVNGHMYQVAIPGRPEDFFNQALNLSEQSPAVRAAAGPLYDAVGLSPDARGGNLVYELRQRALDDGVPFRKVDQHVSRQFQDAGIPGHSYSGDGGLPNYVVFDPSGVQIIKSYAGGLPIPGSAAILPGNALTSAGAQTPTPDQFNALLAAGRAT